MDNFDKMRLSAKKVFDSCRDNRYNDDIINKSLRVIIDSPGNRRELAA